jgi:NAD+ synthetase
MPWGGQRGRHHHAVELFLGGLGRRPVLLCRNLGIRLYEHPIKELVTTYARQFEASFGEPLKGLALENLQARARGTTLMEFSNAFGHLLLTTGNKSEVSVGYCTLYGDTNGGLGLLAICTRPRSSSCRAISTAMRAAS